MVATSSLLLDPLKEHERESEEQGDHFLITTRLIERERKKERQRE